MMRLLLKGGSVDHETCVHCQRHKATGDLSPEKARQILHDGTVHGHPITEQQRKYFGAVASGSAMQKAGLLGFLFGCQARAAIFLKAETKEAATQGSHAYCDACDRSSAAGTAKCPHCGHAIAPAAQHVSPAPRSNPSPDRSERHTGNTHPSFAGVAKAHVMGPLSDCPQCSTFVKADVKEPGKRGGRGYRTKTGKWRYGMAPIGAAIMGTKKESGSPHLWSIRDPFAGAIDIEGDTLEEAVDAAYADIPEGERPAYVWHGDEQIPVRGGRCRPV